MNEKLQRKQLMTIIGLHFIANSEDNESYRTGYIVSQVTSDHFLVQYDAMNGGDLTIPMSIVSLEEMNQVCGDCGSKRWDFFRSREQLRDYIDWMNTPSESVTITPLPKNKTH